MIQGRVAGRALFYFSTASAIFGFSFWNRSTNRKYTPGPKQGSITEIPVAIFGLSHEVQCRARTIVAGKLKTAPGNGGTGSVVCNSGMG
jgi:hypothetical protein